MIPLFRKADPLDKTNYRPVSLLSHIWKVFERIIYNLIDKGKPVSAIFMDLSKGFATLNHDLLIAKSLSYIHSYLKKLLQKTNVKNNFSWKEFFSMVPQGFILRPLLFSVYINGIFFFVD